ncbi:MAG: hypothetical protein US25_C0044G0006 [Candidatus Moranbacteria bacterium GW2011_GWE1_36_7]|nr:MAG: hypothetical protein UR99_C0064G0006 [Candidatus Moranbacteria bacterium GW2011_GWD2_36_12]KKQ05499.1 MAG: hypothetical protein US16_C0033G0005 [Candidatus Moranbacteria bacterium GW2011_GWE2_36_40]KKQ12800.1 MAG: hypothetical protein US25_C0044G0006 [Candidatus Moranbacteria bacterium GW2011_GWE1_36_7]
MRESLTILIGNPENATHRIVTSQTSAKTPEGKILCPRFEIFADTDVHGEIGTVTVKSVGLSAGEELLIMEGLAKYNGTTGASARKYLSEKNYLKDTGAKSKGFKSMAVCDLSAIKTALGVEEIR